MKKSVWWSCAAAICSCPLTAGGLLGAQQRVTCDAPELVSVSVAYNELVCEGIDRLDRGDALGAISRFERGMEVRLFEIPNIQLYSRLALAYAKAGDRAKAWENLAKGRLSLLVLIGVYKCEERSSEFQLTDRYGEPIRSEYSTEIARRMCGEVYQDLYDTDSLESFARKARLVENYLSIERELTPGKH